MRIQCIYVYNFTIYFILVKGGIATFFYTHTHFLFVSPFLPKNFNSGQIKQDVDRILEVYSGTTGTTINVNRSMRVKKGPNTAIRGDIIHTTKNSRGTK